MSLIDEPQGLSGVGGDASRESGDLPECRMAGCGAEAADPFLGVLRKMARWSHMMGNMEDRLELAYSPPSTNTLLGGDLSPFRQPRITLDNLDGFIGG